MPKIRLDQYLLTNALAQSLSHAQSLCMQGLVHDQNKQLTKAGMMVDQNRLDIKVKHLKNHDYVARSALKLKAAMQEFSIIAQDKICADLGCRTGGFSEVLLEYGTQTIYAVDVAYGEFSSKLRNNEKIILLERTNVRFLNNALIPQMLDIIVCDLSFIGLKLALPASLELLKPGGILLTLIKPQFEVEKDQVGPKGIITDPALHSMVCADISSWLSQHYNFTIIGILPSPILGAKGNQEFILYAKKN